MARFFKQLEFGFVHSGVVARIVAEPDIKDDGPDHVEDTKDEEGGTPQYNLQDP